MLYLAEELSYISKNQKERLIQEQIENSKIIRGLIRSIPPKN